MSTISCSKVKKKEKKKDDCNIFLYEVAQTNLYCKMPLNYISCHYWLDLLRKELFIFGGNCPDDDRSALLQHAVIATPAAVFAGCNTIIPKPFVLNFNLLTQKV